LTYESRSLCSNMSITSYENDPVRKEVAAQLQQVIEDGAPEGSDLHFFATHFLSPLHFDDHKEARSKGGMSIPKGSLVWRTGLSGGAPDSVRCTRGLRAELLSLGNFQSQRAIIHRTVRCTPDSVRCSKKTRHSILDTPKRSNHLQFHTRLYTCQVLCDKVRGCCSICKSRCTEAIIDSLKNLAEAMTIKHQKFLNSNNLLAKDMDIKSDEKATKIDTNVQPVDVKSNEKGAGVGIVEASHGKAHVVITNPLITVPIQLEIQIVNRLDGNNGTSLNPPVAAAVDQMYNDMNIFNVESEAGGFFLGNQLEVGNVVRNDVGENWLQVQNAHTRFPCSNVLLRYYNILCGMGRSQWKDLVAVRFSKTTTVNWESFGLSIEPNGHCDNFFIAGFCRKHFEDIHPRLSKKHFFYPKVGHSMMEYNSQYEVEDLRKSFLGANSALKLHRSNKLYFPVCHANHWFLFIVDLKNKRFVFMDSYFDEEDPFQCFVRDKLIRVFKVLWLLYSDSNIDVLSFKILYPAVPKQENTHDCGIFTLQYMEYWDISVDMMLKFRTEDIPQIRITLANDLYFSEKNAKDKSLVRNMFLQ
ncbi:hypothetical protein ACJX0J_013590, partial [Zea mays]